MAKTYDEILNQYEAMGKTKRYLDSRAEAISVLLGEQRPIVAVGCGSSYSLAQSAAFMAQLRLKRPAMALAGGDLLLRVEEYRPLLEGCLMVVLSRSGETSEVVRAVEIMRGAGISFKLLALTCVEGSAIEKAADVTLVMPWAFDESVCQTRTVSCLYYAFTAIIANAAGMASRLDTLEAFVRGGAGYLKAVGEAVGALAKEPWDHAVVLGDGELYGIAQEGALAFKEICQLSSNDYHVLDVRHGPMVLINQKTLVIIAVSCADEPMQRNLVADIVKKGATVVTVSAKPFEMAGVHAISTGGKADQAVLGLGLVAVCQMMAYEKAKQTGANPDAPDGLTAWIELK